MAILQAILALGAKPFYAFLYKSTVASYPPTFIFVSIGFFSIMGLFTLLAHFGLKSLEKKTVATNEIDEKMRIKTNMDEPDGTSDLLMKDSNLETNWEMRHKEFLDFIRGTKQEEIE